eukprot:88788-Pyramimonas_sp.AAC.1
MGGVMRRQTMETRAGEGVRRVPVSANGEIGILPSRVEAFGLAEVDAADENGCEEQHFSCRDFAT